jgi:hypothetical protein
MKKMIFVVAAVFVMSMMMSCETLTQVAMDEALSSVGSSGSSGTAAAAPSSVDFQSGEILCSSDSGDMTDSIFKAAKVLKPASAATKNQAEVLWLENGKKAWANYVVNSRKSEKADLAVGQAVFFLYGWAEYDEIDSDSYRKGNWKLGYITSVEDLYKNLVEISGSLYNIKFLRIPTDPIE